MPSSHEHGTRDLLLGVLLTVCACFTLAGMDSLGKHLMQSLPANQVVWARYTFHTLLVGLVFGLHGGFGFMRSDRPRFQALRGAALMGVTFAMYLAIRHASLADATAIMFLAPVLVTLLAGPMLGEPLRAWHWGGALLGFAGVLLIVRPGADMQVVLLLPLASAILLALYFVMTRMLRGQDGERTTLFHTTATGTVLLTLILPFSWQAPTAAQWLTLISLGVLGALGHLLLIRAFHLAAASSLSPFLNAQIVAAAIFSAVFFSDVLEVWFYLGAGLIAGAGIMVWYRDSRG